MDFGLSSGYVHALQQTFLKTIKKLLESLLNEGLGELPSISESYAELMQTEKAQRAKEKQFLRNLRSG